MEYGLTMDNLEICFNSAVENGANYVAVLMYKEGFPKHEIVVNPIENAEKQLEWYRQTYDYNLKHKYSKEKIIIVGFTYGTSLMSIEYDLIGNDDCACSEHEDDFMGE